MADEVDPLEALAKSHLERMQEIADSGFAKAEALCDESLLNVKKRAGVKSAILEKALSSLGIVEPTP